MTDPLTTPGKRVPAESEPLTAPLEISFDYTRSLGPVLTRFMTALADHRILAARAADGRLHAPPFEYDPATSAPPAELAEVGPDGTVISWSWMQDPLEGQPLTRPFGWALIRLDGADTAMLHAVDARLPARMRTGMRVRPRWADTPGSGMTDIACFEPCPPAADDTPAWRGAADSSAANATSATSAEVSMITTPVRLSYTHTASPGESAFLRALAQGRLIGQRCPACGKVYIPPRGACPADGVPTSAEVALPDTGIVTTFCVVNVPFRGQRVTPPYVAASILLDGADIAIQHVVLGCPPEEVRMGMRVQAQWKPPSQWGTTAENIDHFRPTGEPDAPYGRYAGHL